MNTVRIVDVDLSPFSLGASWVSLSSPLAPFVITGWLLLVLLIAVVSLPLAIMLGILTVIAIIAGLVITMKQRMSASTTGHKSAFIRPEHAGQRPADFDRTFGEIIDAVDAFRRTGRKEAPEVATSTPAVDPARRWRATLYIVLGVLILVIGLPALLILRITGAIPIVLLMGAMFAMFTRARRVLQPSANVAQRDDPRRPILFLRSFQDDRIKVKVRVSLAGIPSYQRLRFEEALGLRLNEFGPFLGIGEPGEGLPRLGAARAYLADDQWQAVVVNWIGEARLIAMLCGPTRWIQWEMQNIIKNQRLERVLLLLPPGRSSWTAQRRRQRWDNIVRSLQGTPYAAALQQLRIEDVLLVQFLADGRVRVFRSANDLVQDYELALTLAIYAALAAPDTREPKPADESAAPAWTPLEVTGTDLPGVRRQTSYLAAKIALLGLAGGMLAGALGMTPAFRLNAIVLLSLRGLIFAAAVTAGAWLFYDKEGRFLGWLFGCVATGYFIAGSAASLINPLIPRGSLRMGFVQIPFVITWLIIPLGVLAALAARFRNFRTVGVWVVMLAVGLVVGLVMSLGFDPRENVLLAALRFSVLPWTSLAACIGYGLSTREHPW